MIRRILSNWKPNSIAVSSLAIALALGVVALSISNAILLRPPLSRDPGQLAFIYTSQKPGEAEQLSYLDYQYIREHVDSFSEVGAFNRGISKGTITFHGRDGMAMENTVSDNYFQVMGIHPFIGRFFNPGDDTNRIASVVLSYAFWKREGGDPAIIGKSIEIGDQARPIIGVAPREFLSPVFGFGCDLVLNIANSSDNDLKNREVQSLMPVGRLKPGVGLAQARAEVRGLWSQLARGVSKADKDRVAVVAPISVYSPEGVKTSQLISAMLIACSVLVLLIACANTANLLLALATLRRQEALIKTALGASRGRLIREFMKETSVICACGGILGFGLASLALSKLSRFDLNLPGMGVLPISADLQPGVLVAVLTVALIAIASVASGLAPALYASKPNLASALTGEIAIGGAQRGWIRGIVVSVQVAVCTLVLAGTGQCWQSLHNLRSVDPGFSPRNIASVIAFPGNGIEPERGLELGGEMRRTMNAMHGVESVALADALPLGGSDNHDNVHFADRPDDPDKKNIIDFAVVDEYYFATLRIPMLEGRVFRASDAAGSPDVVVINRFMAEKYWPHHSAVGRTIRIIEDSRHPGAGSKSATIVGVVANSKYNDLDEIIRPYLYHPFAQHFPSAITIIVRTEGDPRQWLQPMVGALKKLDVALPLPPTTLDSWMNLTLFVPILTLGCVSGISILAMLLATAGLFGAISYSVSDRRRELGIRIALGARPGQVTQMIFRQMFWIVGVGIVAGLGLSVVAGIVFNDQFYQVGPVEWTVLAPVGLGMVAISLAIAVAATHRWTRMNPMDAVRHV